MSLSSGTRVGPYEILSALGAGGMGEVYRARDPRLGREVAIKVLPDGFASDPDRLRRFEQEARASGALNHSNILVVLDVGTNEGAPYLVSELLEGESLRERLRHGALPLRKAIEYGVQIAQGLAAAHEKSIVHRDLKPENLFITKDGRVKILDFGLAKVRRQPEELASDGGAESTATGAVLGTASYMSPEQVRGLPADHRSDIFSLGIVLYEMLSRERPFKGETSAETMTAILKQEPPDLLGIDGLSPVLDRIVRRCLEKNPDDRFHSARDLAFALEATSGPSGTQMPRRGALRPWRRPTAIVAAILLAVTSAGSWLLARRTAAPALLSYERLTFQRGRVFAGRFAPDDQTVVYGAAWSGGATQLFSTRIGGPEARAFDLEANILSVSATGELAVALWKDGEPATLARLPMVGGAPREMVEDVSEADWSPDGLELAIVRQVGTRQRLEYPVGRVLYEASEIVNPRVSREGDRVAFIDASGVCVVDRAGARTVLAPIKPSALGSLAWSPSGDEVWFIDSRRLADISLNAVTRSGRRRLLARFPSPVFLDDVSRDGRALVKFFEYEKRVFGMAPGASRARELSWLQGSRAMDLSADGRLLLFHESGQGGGGKAAVYLRHTDDDAPPVRLGEGVGMALSPDTKWAATWREDDSSRLWLLPTGAGEPRSLTSPGLEFRNPGSWLPDGRHILFQGQHGSEGTRSFLLELEHGQARPVTPEGIVARAVSPDGRLTAGRDAAGRILLFPTKGGEPRVVPGPPEPAGSQPISFSSDGRSLYVARSGRTSASVLLRQIETGRETLWKEIVPADPAGLWLVEPLVSPDGRAYVYTCHRELASLYVVEGLR